ncbi:MAG: L-seryl-tRNA(Sec) selenium transferase [Candidatus Zixiibacteriota bacterium]
MTEKIIKSKRDIPAVEILASDNVILEAASGLPRPFIVEVIRSAVERFKSKLGDEIEPISFDRFREFILNDIVLMRLKKIGRVINGAGILVHTNLGRAPLSEMLFDNIKSHVTGYGNLEFDVYTGKRGKRGALAEKYLSLISGAEAGTIVNNNAAALFLILNTLANRRKVVISRGELVQIGGGFRIPDIIRKSGARLVEVGTSNITNIDDYEAVLQDDPALILKVHKSNFAVTGFTDEPGIKELVALGRKYNVPVVNDLGSGVLIDTTDIAGVKEPSVQSSVRDNADLTCFSGDKLLGGLQAGLIVGKQEFIERIKKNPIYRAMRVDKIVFSAVEEMLGYYLDNTWKENIKLWRLATVSESELYQRGRSLLDKIGAGDRISLEGSQAEMGGGALPGIALPSVALVFHSSISPEKLAALFRRSEPPVVGRISEGRFMIDLKAVDDDDAELLAEIIKNLSDRF